MNIQEHFPLFFGIFLVEKKEFVTVLSVVTVQGIWVASALALVSCLCSCSLVRMVLVITGQLLGPDAQLPPLGVGLVLDESISKPYHKVETKCMATQNGWERSVGGMIRIGGRPGWEAG